MKKQNKIKQFAELMYTANYIDWVEGPRHKQLMQESAELCEKIRHSGSRLVRPILDW